MKYIEIAAVKWIKRHGALDTKFVKHHILDGVYCWRYYINRAQHYRDTGDNAMHQMMRAMVRTTQKRMCKAYRANKYA